MKNEKPNAQAATDFGFVIPCEADWLKSFADTPWKLYAGAVKGALGFTASRLQDQADYMRKLSDCSNPTEALNCQWAFAQQYWARCTEEGSKLVDSLRVNLKE
jgi:hypothetical protein